MSIRITSNESKVALFDSASGFAFGPVMDDDDEAEAFLRFAERETDEDIRLTLAHELEALYIRFRDEEWETA